LGSNADAIFTAANFFRMAEPRIRKTLTVAYTSQQRVGVQDIIVPMIRLRGKWLAAAGFSIGDRIELIVSGGTIRVNRLSDGTPQLPD